jgi:uncharacterized membrane protein
MTSLAQGDAEPRSWGRLLGWLLALSAAINVCFIVGMFWVRATIPAAPTPQERMLAIGEELKLAPDQHDAFQQFQIEMRRSGRQLHESNMPLLQRAWDELGKPQPDQALLSQIIDQTSENRRAYQKTMSVTLARFLSDLTPEQRAQFIELVKRRGDPAAQHLHRLIMP